jgi:hypothetical protein
MGAAPEVGGVDPAAFVGEEGVLGGGLDVLAAEGQVDLRGVEMHQHSGDSEQAGGAARLVVGQHKVADADRADRAQAVGGADQRAGAKAADTGQKRRLLGRRRVVGMRRAVWAAGRPARPFASVMLSRLPLAS